MTRKQVVVGRTPIALFLANDPAPAWLRLTWIRSLRRANAHPGNLGLVATLPDWFIGAGKAGLESYGKRASLVPVTS